MKPGRAYRWTRFRISALLLLILLAASYFAIVVVPELDRRRAFDYLSRVATVEKWGYLLDPSEPTSWQLRRQAFALGVSPVQWGEAHRIEFAPMKANANTFPLCTEMCSKLEDLCELDLSRSDIGDQEVRLLRKAPVRFLSLDLTEVIDASLEIFAKMPNLEGLDIRGTAVSEEAVRRFRKRIPEMIVDHCYWDSRLRSAARSAEVNGFQLLPKDDKVDVLSGVNPITDPAGCRKHLASLSPLKLELDVADGGINHVIDLPNLHRLSTTIYRQKVGKIRWDRTSDSLKALSCHTSEAEWLRLLDDLPKTIELSEITIGLRGVAREASIDKVLGELHRHPKLETIRISAGARMTADSIRKLQTLDLLKRLEFDGCWLDEGCFGEIAKCHSLKHLTFSGARATWAHLGTLAKSKSLQVMHWEFGLPLLTEIMKLQPMRQLEVVSLLPDEGEDVWFFKELGEVKRIWEQVVSADDTHLAEMVDQTHLSLEYLRELRQFRQGSPWCHWRNLPSLSVAIDNAQDE